ncbi:potential ubiquitin-like protein-specific protease [Pseudozyma hubeiensis SY62]|uniref:Potential ubiquitin-like protein-specific protease n=1 Tax=Pseudozyma hubeiensis (strain SY62) TaxID=1305764 RepID=R9PCR0_PSEHS|nr:potential ubiquitin-like protein-specific protease [Pseudozyma hubeiensis SY62]GAC99188.1 potential ubiquitin-like protein-specific protease [Pseudozyma hubeiensis SY62]
MLFDSNPLVVSTNEACLHKSDVKTLKHDEWLGDNVLAFHAEWLQALGGQLERASSGPPNVKMFPPSVVEVLCTLESASAPDTASVVPKPTEQFLLLPVSDRYSPSSPGHAAAGSHWSLLLVDAASGAAIHLDSLGECNRSAAAAVHSSILRLVQPRGIQHGSSPPTPFKVDCLQQQENGSDCGIYVLLLSSLLHRQLCTLQASSYDLAAVVETVCVDATPSHVGRFRKLYKEWLEAWGKATHHEEHVDPNQKVKAHFLKIFSEIGVE